MELGGGERFNLGSGVFRNSNYTDRDMELEKEEDVDELGVCSDDDDSVSSVGSRSDSSDDEEDERSCKEALEATDALQEVTPVRRGISKFYSGKSKSFTSLADAVSSASVKELAKPETLYSKKQNNLLARKIPDYKQFNSSRSHPGGPFKKLSPNNESCSSSVSPPFSLPPLHPQRKKIQNPGSSVSPPRQKCSPWRSFSVSDLQGMVHHA